MASNRRDLKAFVRYDGNNNAVASSLIFQKNKPKVGKWKEYKDISLCCPSDCTCDGNFNWKLIDEYAPAFDPGWITFPNHIDGQPNLNPNLIGTGGYELYINLQDLNSNLTSYLNLLVGNNGILTLVQGSNSVTYSFTNQAFTSALGIVSYDDAFGISPLGSLTVVSPAASDFNTKDCISIYISLETPPYQTCTINSNGQPNPYSATPYFSMQHYWPDAQYTFTLISLNINGVEYATGQTLTINTPAELVLGIGLDGRTYYTNTVDWINNLIPISTGLMFYDDFNTVSHPENMLFQVIIQDVPSGIAPGVCYYKYDNLGLLHYNAGGPIPVTEIDWYPIGPDGTYKCSNP